MAFLRITSPTDIPRRVVLPHLPIVSSVSRDDHRIGSKAEQATASVPTEAVVAQPARMSSRAARIARLADAIDRTDGGLRAVWLLTAGFHEQLFGFGSRQAGGVRSTFAHDGPFHQ